MAGIGSTKRGLLKNNRIWRTMMTVLMISLAKLLMGFIFIGGPLIFLMVLLGVRDHRKLIVEGMVSKELNSPDLRGLVVADTKCALLSKRCRVEVDMRDCSIEQIWDIIERLTVNLPSSVRLVVNEVPIRSPKAIFSLEIRGMTQPRARRGSVTLNVMS
jgi:hypothetical protein